MTTVYFIRHAQSNRFVSDDRTRPLTDEGLSDTLKIAEKLSGAGIQHIVSSPYKRTIQTVTKLAETLKLETETDEDFRERNAGSWHGENFLNFIKQQWEDFSYYILDGECLADVQKRNINALKKWVEKYKGETIAIATHGTALSTMLNYFDSSFGYDNFMRIIDFMPYVVKICIDDEFNAVSVDEIMYIYKEFK